MDEMELATNGFRGHVLARLEAVKDQLDGLKRWTEKHEQEEFTFHGRVEEQMRENTRVMAVSVEDRKELTRRVAELESDVRALWTLTRSVQMRVTLIFGGLCVISGTVLPLAGYALWYLFNHHQITR